MSLHATCRGAHRGLIPEHWYNRPAVRHGARSAAPSARLERSLTWVLFSPWVMMAYFANILNPFGYIPPTERNCQANSGVSDARN
jgi:hypothetical protein